MSECWSVDTLTLGAANEAPTRARAQQRPAARRQMRLVRGRYDAAGPDVHNERHWAGADALSARSANSPGVRQTLRNRARYEVANNCYARGMLNTLADVEIGYGATLHLPRPRDASQRQRNTLRAVEQAFEAWALEVGLWQRLWTMRVAKAQDGEACAVLRANPGLQSLVQLDVQLIEAEQLSHGMWADQVTDPNQVDGVEVDDYGRVVRYLVLPEHPGEAIRLQPAEPMPVPPSQFLHWFRQDRPGQLRGVPEITPALPLFAQLRRYTLATLTAAESAADIAAVIKSNIVPEYADGDAVDQITYHDIERGMFMELPDGRDINQLKAEQPTTTYAEFKRELLAEIGRCLQLPRAIALADASNYNYASGRLDRQAFDRHVEAAQFSCEQAVLAKIWLGWWYEASRIVGYLPRGAAGLVEGMRPRWLWRVLGHVDRQKEEAGIQLAMTNGTTTLAEECGRNGLFWEEVLEQQAAEQRRRRELGLIGPPREGGGQSTGEQPEDGESDGDDDQEQEQEQEQQASGL